MKRLVHRVKFVHIKSSLHWTLDHVAELIAKIEGTCDFNQFHLSNVF